VYQVASSGELATGGRRLLGRGRTRVGRTVLLLGLTSLLTDVSSEMVAAILPLYLVVGLGLSPLQFGLVDGLYQGATAPLRLAGGLVADRFRRHKEVAVVGYGLSAACKLALALVGSTVGALTAIVVVDRAGKGIRTAPRDALISLSTPRSDLGTAFGVHRALDTTGALLGPLVAFGLLFLAPGRFDTVFVVSFAFALVGVGILVLFVQNRPARDDEPAPGRRASVRGALALLREPRFRRLSVVAVALALATVSDGFVYLSLQRRLEFDTGFFPLLYLGTALAYMLLAIPAGRLADRVGRARVFLGGYVLLLLVYGSLLLPSRGGADVVLYLLLFGAFYAATDGVVVAAASTVLPPDLRGSGLALLATGTSSARFGGSVVFGALWAGLGLETAVVCFAVALAAATAAGAVALLRAPGAARA
jgi:MFS family permease